jgi:hypothetical protein
MQGGGNIGYASHLGGAAVGAAACWVAGSSCLPQQDTSDTPDKQVQEVLYLNGQHKIILEHVQTSSRM